MTPGALTVELDATTDVMRALRCFEDCGVVLLLDSAARIRERDARFTFLTADPLAQVTWQQATYGSQPFDTLRRWQARLPPAGGLELPPFPGGIGGLMSYELGGAFERVPSPQRDPLQIPALTAGLFDWSLVWDHLRGTVTCWVLPIDGDEDPVGSRRRMERRRDWILARLQRGRGADVKPAGMPGRSRSDIRGNVPLPGVDGVFSDFTSQQYIAAVERVVEYIRAGDIFQANLSQRLTAECRLNAVELFDRLRRLNAAPFCSLLQTPAFAIASASPERFLKVTDGRFVETRPIKGTRRRQRLPIADLYTSQDLTTSEKDRAENVMIVDLLRNDLSRNCRAGSVRVSGLCEVEVFETVQHLVSTVVGELIPGRDLWDLCAGCFPGGSITGAPKIRAMQIIAELEPVVRGAYCGSMFCCGPDGQFDSSILIRTFTLKDGWLSFPVGGGIVADSEPVEEYHETLHKASGMLRSLRS